MDHINLGLTISLQISRYLNENNQRSAVDESNNIVHISISIISLGLLSLHFSVFLNNYSSLTQFSKQVRNGIEHLQNQPRQRLRIITDLYRLILDGLHRSISRFVSMMFVLDLEYF